MTIAPRAGEGLYLLYSVSSRHDRQHAARNGDGDLGSHRFKPLVGLVYGARELP